MDNSKFFANEEVLRAKKEAQDKDDQLQALHRKYLDEAKAREHLQREYEALKVKIIRVAQCTYGQSYQPDLMNHDIYLRSIDLSSDMLTSLSGQV